MDWKENLKKLATLTLFLSFAFASPYKPKRDLESLPNPTLPKPEYEEDYFRQIVSKILYYDERSEGDLGNTKSYRRNVRDLDLTMLLLGSYLNAWRSGAKEEAKRLWERAKKELEKGRIGRRADEGLLSASEKRLKEHANSLMMLYSASVSYGHIASPNEVQAGNLSPSQKTAYAFRLAQQAQRNAVLQEYAERILELKQELAFLQKQVDLYCKNQSDDAIYLWDVEPSDFKPLGMPSRTAVFCVPCEGNQLLLEIQLAIRKGLALISQQNSALGHRLCLLYLGQVTQTKALLTQTELQLASLAVQYSKLNIMEKDKK